MAIDRTKLLPPGQPGTPEGTVVNPGVPAGYVSEKQYNGLNKNILAIRSNLRAIADLLVRRDTIEATEDKAEEKQLRRERQESRVQDVESNLGTKIKNALVKPLEAMKQQIQGPFGRIMEALKALFFGFVGMKAIDALTAWAEGDTDSLEALKNDLIQALAVGAGIFVALNGGIGLILGAAGALAGTILGALPAIFGLIVNPYVWLGALVALGGLALSDFLLSKTSGFDSFNPTSREVQRRMATIGPEATLRELEQLHEDHLAEHGMFDIKGERQQMRQEMDRIREAMEGKGPYAYVLGKNISEADKALFNNMRAAMSKIKGYREMYDVTKLAHDAAPEGEDKEKLKKKMEQLGNQISAAQDFIKSQRSSLSAQGRETFAFIMGGDAGFFKKTLDPGFKGFGFGDFPDFDMKSIERVEGRMDVLKSAPDNLLAPQSSSTQGQIQTQSQNTSSGLPDMLKISMDDTQSALKEFNFTKASQIDMSGLFDDNLNINIVPFPTESEDNEMTTIPTTTIQDMNIPNIFTSDSNNFYRDFTSAMFES